MNRSELSIESTQLIYIGHEWVFSPASGFLGGNGRLNIGLCVDLDQFFCILCVRAAFHWHHCHKASAECKQSFKVEVIVLRHGVPEDEILNYAESHPCDPVILGYRYRSTLDRIYVGSTTRTLLSLSLRPILVVPIDTVKKKHEVIPAASICISWNSIWQTV